MQLANSIDTFCLINTKINIDTSVHAHGLNRIHFPGNNYLSDCHRRINYFKPHIKKVLKVDQSNFGN